MFSKVISLPMFSARQQTLVGELSALQVPVLDTNIVDAHMRSMVRRTRRSARFWGRLGLTAFLLYKTLEYTAPLLALAVVYTVWFHGDHISLIIPLVVLTAVCLLLFLKVRETSSEFGTAASHWERSRVVFPTEVPDHLSSRVGRALEIPGARVYITRFWRDPIVVAERGRLPFFKERCYIGAWETGNMYLDQT